VALPEVTSKPHGAGNLADSFISSSWCLARSYFTIRQHLLRLIDSFSTFTPLLLPYDIYPHAMRLPIVSSTTIALVNLLDRGLFCPIRRLARLRCGFSPQLCHKQLYADDFFEGESRLECLGSYWMSHPRLSMHLWQSDLHRLPRARFRGRLCSA
jgi:hypothetical protein